MGGAFIKNNFLTLVLVAGFFLSFTMTKGYAGFEWIPPTSQESASPVVKMAPEPAASVEQQVLQAPLEPSSAPQTLLPLAPLEPIESKNPIMKVRQFEPKAEPPKAETKVYYNKPEGVIDLTEKILAKEAEQNQLIQQETLPPLPQPEPTPVTLQPAKTKIMMPEDAPMSAIEMMKDVTIHPLPEQESVQEPVMPQTVTNAVGQSSYVEIMGFGSDMPLALALSQIVPPTYSYSFGETVNPGQKVSWNGGKPWNQVIEEMISPLNLNLSIRGKNVHVGHQKTSMAPLKSESKQAAPKPLSSDFSRTLIKDPGEVASAQPQETLSTIRKIARVDQPEKILPQAGYDPDEEVIVAKVGMDMISQNKELKATAAPQNINLVANNEVFEPERPAPKQKITQSKQIWEAQKGDSLKKTLDFWSKKANFEIVWEANHDYKLESDILVTGSFQRAVKLMFSSAIDAGQAPLITLLDSEDMSQPGRLIIEDDAA